jgi:hypothetical protein
MSGHLGRLVITSVPRGLGGGGGIQPVLRTAGMPLAVSQRLSEIAAYPHPYSGGDPRNPHVFLHRIDRIGGRLLHLLAALRDAGASYTGRSNHLAELLVIDDDVVVGLPAGPAFAARHFPWITGWEGEAREEPAESVGRLPVHDPQDPEPNGRAAECPRWQEATGDAGWAGELAKAFLEGRNAVIEINASQQEIVLQLFVEALRLLPVRDRWRVTFNTCELEFFPAAWRARRLDLPLVGPQPGSNDLRLVLDDIRRDGRRASDHGFSRFARGEAAAPWHATATAPGGARSTGSVDVQPTAVGHGPGRERWGVSPGSSADELVRDRLARLREHRHRTAGSRPVALPAGDARRAGTWIPAAIAAVVAAAAALAVTILPLAPRVAARSNSSESRSLNASIQKNEERKDAENRRQKAEEAEARQQAEVKKAEANRREQERDARLQKEEAEKKRAAVAAQKETAEERTALQKRRHAAFSAASLEKTDYRPAEPPPGPRPSPSDHVHLCDLDAEHPVGLTLSFASVPAPDTEPLEVGPPIDHLTWPVTTEVRDTFISGKSRRRTVCHLVATPEGQLRLRWPQDRKDRVTSWEDPVFVALQNSLLLVSAIDPDSQDAKPILRRKIAFTKPIDPVQLTLDPLAGQYDVDFEPAELKRRLEAIDHEALRWTLELSHPKWGSQGLVSPDKELNIPGMPADDVSVAYEDVDETSGDIVKRQARLSIKAKVTFAPDKAMLTLTPKIAGLDGIPALKALMTFENLLRCRGKQKIDENLRTAIETALRERPKLKERKWVRFLQDDTDDKDNHFRTIEAFRALEIEGQAIASGPGRFYGNNPLNEKWRNRVDVYMSKVPVAKAIRSRFEDKYVTQQGEEVTNAITAMRALADATQPITVRIRALWAEALDPSGTSYPIVLVPGGGHD